MKLHKLNQTKGSVEVRSVPGARADISEVYYAQCPRTDLNKIFLHRPKTITAGKLIPHRSNISKN